ncbi:MAG: LuxR C-terminal-related transcriptional regulator [Ilumatobacteraceae bacterium]
MTGSRLTPRELSLLHLMSLGLSNQGIAVQLNLSVKTVEGSSRSAFLKLGLVEENADENRRVLAIRRYQELVAGNELPPIYLDEAGLFSATLLDEIPRDYDELVAMLETRADASDQPWAMWALASWSAVIADDLPTAARCAARASTRAAQHGKYPVLITAAMEHVIAVAGGAARIDHGLLDQLIAMIAPDAPSVAGSLVDTMDSIVEFAHWMVFCDRNNDARRFIARARRPIGDRLEATREFTANGAEAEICLRTGEWRRVLELVDPVIAASEYGAAYFRALAARASTMAGDFERASMEIRVGKAAATVRNDRTSLRRLQAAEGVLHLRTDAPADAAALLRRLRDSLDPRAAVLPALNPWHAELVEALVRCGEHAEAAAVTDDIGAIAAATGSAWTEALHERCLGLIATEPTAAIRHFEEAATRFGALRGTYEQAVTMRLLAAAWEAAGEVSTAQRVRSDTDELFARCG